MTRVSVALSYDSLPARLMSWSSGWLGLLPRSTSVTVLALIVLGEIGPLNVMLIVHGRLVDSRRARRRCRS